MAFAVLMAGGGLMAAVDKCQGRNLLDALQARDPIAFRRIVDEAQSVVGAEAMFWRIEGKGAPPSYLFGTVHVADPRVQVLPQPVADAIRLARVVALERVDGSEEAVRSVMPAAAALMVDRTRRLDSVLDESDLAIVEEAVTKAGFARELALAFRPWAAALFLSGSDCERARQERGLKPLDSIVAEVAQFHGIEVVGLESILDQYKSMAAIPDDVQIAWLKASAFLRDYTEDMSETSVDLYLTRRIDAIWALGAELSGRRALSSDAAGRLRQGLVDVRNEHMIGNILPLVDKGAAFIAVGATHLPGPKGLVALLRQRDFKVDPVD